MPDAPVFVTANYTLSFDALRSNLDGVDGYILVLDTYGVNVWCAAGKGTFGTDELVERVEATGLREVVTHRELILPQLGAPGIAAHEVKKRTGFSVKYGPVRAADVKANLETRTATREMRTIRFPLRDRLVLAPIELVHVFPLMALVAIVLYFVSGPLAAWGTVAAVLAGAELLGMDGTVLWQRAGRMLALLLALPPVTAFLALNFTGSTPFTSKTGVRKEMFTYIPIIAWTFGIGVVLTIVLTVLRWSR